jgi:hypothetical protein
MGEKRDRSKPSGPARVLFFVVAIAALFAVGVAIYAFVESPASPTFFGAFSSK